MQAEADEGLPAGAGERLGEAHLPLDGARHIIRQHAGGVGRREPTQIQGSGVGHGKAVRDREAEVVAGADPNAVDNRGGGLRLGHDDLEKVPVGPLHGLVSTGGVA
jgi:hypothetical protein